MESCIIYKVENYYKIVTQFKTEAGYFLSYLPVYLLDIECSDLDFEKYVFESLNISKKILSTPKRNEFPKITKEVLNAMKEKSYVSLYKNSISCDIQYDKGKITIYPNKFFNANIPSQGLVWVEEKKIEIDIKDIDKLVVAKKIRHLLNG